MTGIPESGGQMPPWLEQAWLQRYLDRELTADEAGAFEAYLLDKPALVAALEADNTLRATISADPALLLDARGTDAPLAVREPRPRYRLPGAWLSLAAGLLLGVGLAWLGFTHFAGAGADVLAPPRIIFDTLRGELAAPREEAGDPASPIRLYEVPLPAGARIVAAQAVHAGRQVGLPMATPGTDGYLTYALPASWRGQGELHIDVTVGDSQDASLRLTFPL